LPPIRSLASVSGRPDPHGDALRLAAIMGFFFLVVCAVGILRPIKNTLALDGLGATDFYRVYLVSAAAVLVVPPYNRLADRISPRWLIPGAAFFFAANLLLFRALYVEGSAAYGMLFYGWYDLFSAALVTQFFMATQRFFDARSAKRAYPVIVAGGAVGATLGGAITALAAQAWGAPNLMLVAAALITVFGIGLPLVWATEPERLLRPGLKRVARITPAGFREVFANRQVRLIAAGVLLTVVVKQLIDFQFNVVSLEVYQTRDAVAAFQGRFNAATQWIPIVVVIALRPAMSRWGVSTAVLLLPALMLVTTFGVAVWGTLAAVVSAKAAETSLRYSAERTGREILYVPVPDAIKLKAKAYIDVAVEKGAGKVVAAGLIAALLGVGGMRAVGWAAFALCVAWMAAALAIRREYVRTLADAIRGRTASFRGLNASMAGVGARGAVTEALRSDDPLQTAFALEMVEQAGAAEVGAFGERLHALLAHPSDVIRARAARVLALDPSAVDDARVRAAVEDPAREVREAAIGALCAARPTGRAALLEELLGSPLFEVRAAALAGLARGDFGDNGARAAGAAHLRALGGAARTGDREARLEAALAAGCVASDADTSALLRALVADADAEVASAALRAAGRARDGAHDRALIAALGRRGTRQAARDALAMRGAAVVPALSAALLDQRGAPTVRRAIPTALARIHAQQSVDVLFRSIIAPETDQRLDHRSIRALSKLRASGAPLHFDAALVESALDREVACAARYLDAERALGGPAGDTGDAVIGLARRAMQEAWRERREGAFRCLGLLHDPTSTYRCYLAVSGGRAAARGNALEWLEQTIGRVIFLRLAPVLADPRRPGPHSPVRAALMSLCDDEHAWAARCAAEALLLLDGTDEAGAVEATAASGGRREPSSTASRDNAAGAGDLPAASPGDPSQALSGIAPNPPMDLIETVFLLQRVDLLRDANTDHLALLASIAEEVDAQPGAVLLRRDEPTDALYVVVRGAVELTAALGAPMRVEGGTGFGTWALIDESPSLVDARALEPTRLIRIARADFYDLLDDHPELGLGMLQGLARRVRTLVS
jgi:ATP:ADP antiporter, AAA family